MQAELEARSAALAAAQVDGAAAAEASAEHSAMLAARLEQLGAERDELAAALGRMQQVRIRHPMTFNPCVCASVRIRVPCLSCSKEGVCTTSVV